jgi:cation:H+ antiporter
MELLTFSLVFLVAMAVMVFGADVFLRNAQSLGLLMGLSSFTVGVFIVGFGTSLPELTTALLSLAREPSIVVANAVGSNIANILLIGGALAFVGKRVVIDKDLLDAELPFFVISTVLFIAIVFDGSVSFLEAALLTGTFLIYFFYLFTAEYGGETLVKEIEQEVRKGQGGWLTHSHLRMVGLMLLGLGGLLFGAHYVVESMLGLAVGMGIAPGIVAILALAVGTSLPELVVSLKALAQHKFAVAIGNIFGSNAFNILMVVGIPGLFTALPLGDPTRVVGVPILIAASFIFFVIGLARKLYRWEGLMFFLLYVFFVLQLVEIG